MSTSLQSASVLSTSALTTKYISLFRTTLSETIFCSDECLGSYAQNARNNTRGCLCELPVTVVQF